MIFKKIIKEEFEKLKVLFPSNNEMWKNDKPVIIDWEASGYVNPTIELIQVA